MRGREVFFLILTGFEMQTIGSKKLPIDDHKAKRMIEREGEKEKVRERKTETAKKTHTKNCGCRT